MMLSFLKAILSLAAYIVSYMREKQLLDAGSDAEKLEMLNDVLEKTKKARDAINMLSHTADGVRKDKDNRYEP